MLQKEVGIWTKTADKFLIDVLMCAAYHFNNWIYSGLKEMWIISGKSGATTAFPIHRLTEKLEPSVADVLPAVHALTGLYNLTMIILCDLGITSISLFQNLGDFRSF